MRHVTGFVTASALSDAQAQSADQRYRALLAVSEGSSRTAICPRCSMSWPAGSIQVASVPSRKAVDPDAALVEMLRRRDPEATETLIGIYGDRVYRLAVRIAGNPSDAEEVVQDALWTVSRKIDTFRGEAAFGSWVYRITTNAAYQKIRGRRNQAKEVSGEERAPSLGENGRHAELAVDWSPRLEDPALQSELHSRLSAAIAELPADFRVAVTLRDIEGLSHLKIAELLHVTPGTVKSRVHRARLFLRLRLADYLSANLDVVPSSASGDRPSDGQSDRV